MLSRLFIDIHGSKSIKNSSAKIPGLRVRGFLPKNFLVRDRETERQRDRDRETERQRGREAEKTERKQE